MTAQQFRAIKDRKGLSFRQIARICRINDIRTLRRYAAGDVEVSGPVSVIMGLIDEGKLEGIEK